MKKQALFKDIIREIRQSFSRFLSILLIVAVGVGFFVGVKATAPSMHRTAENYFNEQALMDFQILSTVGFNAQDAQAVREIDGVDRVMPAYSADLILPADGQSLVTKVFSLPDDGTDVVNKPYLRQGRMPQAENECLISSSNFNGVEFAIGDQITFADQAGEQRTDEVLKNNTYTIVGMADLPMYISFSYGVSSIGSGVVSCFVMVPESNFLYTRYTELYVTLDAHAQGISAFSQQYDDLLPGIVAQMEQLGDASYETFKKESEAQLEEAQKELEANRADAQAQLDDAAKELEDAKTELDDGLKQLEQGWLDFEQGSADARAQIAEAEKEILSSINTIRYNEQTFLNGPQEINAAQADMERQLAQARKELEDGWKEYNEGLAEYQKQAAEFEPYKAEFEAAEAELNRAEKEYGYGVKEYEDAQKQLDQAKQELAYYEAMQKQNGSSYGISAGSLISEEGSGTGEEGSGTGEEGSGTGEEGSGTGEEGTGIGEEGTGTGEDTGSSDSSVDDTIEQYRQQIADAEAQLADAEVELDAARSELDAAQRELNSYRTQYENAMKQLQDGKAELDQALVELQNGEAEYERERANGYAQIEQARADMANGRYNLQNAYAQLLDGYKELAQAKMDAAVELEGAHEELVSSESELQQAQQQYDQGVAEYTQAVKDVEEELSKANSQFQNARQSLREIVSGKWYCLSRDDIITSYSSFKMDAQRISAIANVFPVFFLLVAALVCLTTMTRMVDEQRTQMGTYKALGYSQRDIMAKYLVYAVLACLIGSACGAALCAQVLPRVIFAAYELMYQLPNFVIEMPWMMLAVSFAAALACTVLVAYVSATKELKTVTAALMRPKAPKAGKRIWCEKIPFVWDRLSFSQKLTMRNLFRYKDRLFMTVIGISGCMALIVAGFGLDNAISPVSALQYDELMHADVTLYLDENYEKAQVQELCTQLNDDARIETAVPYYETGGEIASAENPSVKQEVNLSLPADSAQFAQIHTMRDPQSGQKLALSDDGVIVTDKAAQELGLQVGGQMQLTQNDRTYVVQVAGITENYIDSTVYLSEPYYEKVFGKTPMYNTIYATASDQMTDPGAFSQHWRETNHHIALVYFTQDTRDMIDDVITSMRLVVVVIILCAGILAFIVLYNLTNINISERIREIATIKVLGFKHDEVNMYIFRENLVMCVLGVVCGAVLGYFMAQYIITVVEVDMLKFCRQIRPASYLYAAALTFGFTVLVNLFMTGRMKKISMVESLKAIE